jgi:DNA-binding transcriptional LysR family regulator
MHFLALCHTHKASLSMNYRRLEYFLAVVDAGTVTAAAEELHIAQPALSRQLRTLEREIKLTLFETRGNRLVLTQAAHAFVDLARRLLQQTHATEEAVTALRTGKVSTLTVAATTASIRGFLAPFISTTSREDPLLLARETTHFGIHETLLHGADFIVSPTARRPDLASLDLGSIPLKAYVAPAHPWAVERRAEVTLEELSAGPLILPSHASVSRYMLDDALSQQRLQPSAVYECEDGLSIQALAAAGRGIGVTTDLPHYGAYPMRIRTDTSPRSSREARTDEVLQLPLHVAWLPSHYAVELIRSLGERIRDFLHGQGATLPPVND